MIVSDEELLTRILTHGSQNFIYNLSYLSSGTQGKVILPNAFAKECVEFFFEWYEELANENNET